MQLNGRDIDKRCPPGAPNCGTPEERAKQPDYYWCIGFEDAPTQYFWDEIAISKEEYEKAKQPAC